MASQTNQRLTAFSKPTSPVREHRFIPDTVLPGADPFAAQFPTADLDNAVAPAVGDALERGSAPGDGLAGLELPGETAAGDARQTPPGALDPPPVSAGLTTSRPVPVRSADAPGSQDVASETVAPQAVSAAIAPASAGGDTLAVMPATGAIVAGGAQPLDSSGVFASPPAPFAFVPMHSIGEDNLEELIDHLNRNGEQWEPGAVVHVAFPQSLGAIPDYFRDMDGLANEWSAAIGGLTFFSGDEQDLVMQALGLWADVANIHFAIAEPGDDVEIYFYALEYGADFGGYSTGVDEAHGSHIVLANWAKADLTPGAFGFRAIIHEGGHSIGLDHPSPYDVGDASDNVEEYQPVTEYIEDTLMYSIMSYNLAFLTGYDANGTDGQVMTPRTHDIYVMQQLYGVNWDARDGNSTYGYNATGVGGLYDFTNYGGANEHDLAQLTIWDGGGVDWLDLSGDNSGVTLDLRPGAFSSTHGMTYNLSLAYVPDFAPDEFAGYIENAAGGGGNDSITGNDRDNVLHGNGGHDTLVGLGGADVLHGDGGNDRLEGGFGTDTFYGGDGVDTIDYTYSSGNWTVDLAFYLDDPDDIGVQGRADAGGATEEIFDVENVTMGSGDDHVTGSDFGNDLSGNGGDDTLIGRAGDDYLYGGDGDDTLEGDDGYDRLYGEAGNDTLIGEDFRDYLYGGIGNDDIDGGNGADLLYGQDGHDDIEGGNDNDDIWGGDGNDDIHGGDGYDEIFGGDGNDDLSGDGTDDSISGGDGNDTIDGGEGGDVIAGGAGDDLVSGGVGIDHMDGGDGNDTVDYRYSAADWTLSLTFETASAGGDVESILDFEGARMGSGDDRVRGTGVANNLYGGGGDDELTGLGGADWLDGQGGDDLLNGGTGDDFLIGGSGNDTASYHDEFSGVLVDLGFVGVQNTVGGGNDLLQSIENLVGSTHDDWLIGNAVDNQLHGGLGADQMFGGAGADILLGENGNDNLFGGAGNDVLSGGNGIDWASYLFEDAGVWINLTTQNSQNTFGSGYDTLISIENVAGTGFGDILVGNGSANRLEGYGGADLITGAAGNDVLFGHAGDDSLNGGVGNDVLEGGDGSDWALFNTGLSAGVVVDLNVETQNTGAGIDTLRDIENVHATHYGDFLTGNGVANELRGEGGNDWMWGNGGNDTVNGGSGDDAIAGGAGMDEMIGGSGDDHMWGGTNRDTFVFATGWGNDWIWDYQAGYDKIDLTAVGSLDNLIELDIEDTADGVSISYGAQSILLVGIQSDTLQDSDFVI